MKLREIAAWIGVGLLVLLLVGGTWYFNEYQEAQKAKAWSNMIVPNLGGPHFGGPTIQVPDDWEPQEEK